MKYSFVKKRAINSYWNITGDFSKKEKLTLCIDWIIDDKLVHSRIEEIQIIDSKISWIMCSASIDEKIREYFEKVYKLIVFG